MEQSKGKIIGFWIATGLIVVSQLLSGVLDWMSFEPIAEGLTKLGYPLYVLKILGTFKILGAIAIAIPGAKRLKEWAYAGFVFDFIGAVASHLLAGDVLSEAMPAGILLVILLVSYFLRPADRKL